MCHKELWCFQTHITVDRPRNDKDKLGSSMSQLEDVELPLNEYDI